LASTASGADEYEEDDDMDRHTVRTALVPGGGDVGFYVSTARPTAELYPNLPSETRGTLRGA
jgi:hypothetical protein